MVQERLLQRLQRGELLLIQVGESLGFCFEGVEFFGDCNLRVRVWIANFKFFEQSVMARIPQRLQRCTAKGVEEELRIQKWLWREKLHAVRAENEIEVDVFDDLGVVAKNHNWSGDFENVRRVVPIAVGELRFLRNNWERAFFQKLLPLNLRGVFHILNAVLERLLHPPRAALGEDGLEVAFEEGAGVLEVLFGVGFGGGEALKRFVQQADDPLLFGQRGGRNGNQSQVASANPVARRAGAFLRDCREVVV